MIPGRYSVDSIDVSFHAFRYNLQVKGFWGLGPVGIQLQEISCVRVVGHATWCVPCGKQGACREGRWGEGGDIEVQVTVITKCVIISSRSYGGLLVLSHPTGGLIIDT